MSKRTLLLADDSVTIQKVVNLTFADEGIDVVTVGDGDSAMQKISEISPDVVLADVHMPGLNGYQICEIVRENPATRNLPIVLLVGSFEPFDEGEAARVGANAYLTKPFQSIRQLVTQVTDLMQSASPEPEQQESAPAPAAMEVHEHPTPEKVPDTTDIDSLYHQSFGGPATAAVEPSVSEPSAPESEVQTEAEASYNAYGDQTYSEEQTDTGVGTPPYVDAGMDDEMIETSYAGGIEQPPPATELAAQYETPEQSEESYSQDVASEHTTEPAYGVDSYTADEREEMPEMGWAPVADQAATAGAFDSYAEDRTEMAPNIETAADSHQEFDEFSRTEQIPASITASHFNLDELEILDLPPLENGNTQEFNTTQAEGGGKEIVSLSPELMDILVQRVVDKLSKDK